MAGRTFVATQAVRSSVPLLVGLYGPSGSGKTFSALRLATGIQKVRGGDIYVVDTEARRALHYADNFCFRHVPFVAPFGPLDYLSAIEFCRDNGAKVVVIDSLSHEHEGPGGVLEMHEQELDALSRGEADRREKVKFLAWAKPKAARQRLINSVLQMDLNLICCFRAKEKIKIVGKQAVPMGWLPIAGEEFVYEMTLNCLLPPSSGGVPQWHPGEVGEKLAIKLPEQFRTLFAKSAPLDEGIGQAMARWASGADIGPVQTARPASPTGPTADAVLRELEKIGVSTDRALELVGRASIVELGVEDIAILISKGKAIKGGTPVDVAFPQNTRKNVPNE